MNDRPHFWQDETGGELGAAVFSYLQHEDLTARQVLLLRLYLKQWIDAPVWAGGPGIEGLRQLADRIASQHDVDGWLERALDVGIDPL